MQQVCTLALLQCIDQTSLWLERSTTGGSIQDVSGNA